jgi:hypothetical protein
MLLGNFTVRSTDPLYAISAPAAEATNGSWTDFGYPFFSGTASYTAAFDLPGIDETTRVRVEAENVADAVTVIVNKTRAGTRLWRPWSVDITHLVKEGRNELELWVTNTMQNMLERNPKPSGLLGPVKIIAGS